MKKLYLPLLTLVLGFLFPLLVQADFPDVPKNSEYYEAVSALENIGVVQGFPDGNFYPEQEVTRAQLLKMAYLAQARTEREAVGYEDPHIFPFNDLESIQVEPPAFDDFQALRVDPNAPEWFEYYIAYGKEKGLLEGYDGNVFKPTQPVTLGETAKIIVEISGKGYSKKEGPWDRSYIESLSLQQALPPSVTSNDQTLNRAEVAQIINRYILNDHGSMGEKQSNRLYWDGENYVAYNYLGRSGRYYDYHEKEGVIYGGRFDSDDFGPLDDIDLNTFRIEQAQDQYLHWDNSFDFTLGVAADGFNVLDGNGEPIPASEGSSFEIIEGSFSYFRNDGANGSLRGYGKDASHAYHLVCYGYNCDVLMIQGSDAASFEVLNQGFSKDKNGFYKFDQVAKGKDAQIDVDSFTFLTPNLAKDKNKAYYFVKADGKTFEIYDYLGYTSSWIPQTHYLSDGERIYSTYGTSDREMKAIQELEGANLNTFDFAFIRLAEDKAEFPYIAYDDHSLYLKGEAVPNSAGGRFELIGESLNSLNYPYLYARDDQHVYLVDCYEGCDLMGQLPYSNAGAFKILNEGYSTDGERSYYWENLLDNEGSQSFESLGAKYAKGNKVYHRGSVVANADPESFEVTLPNDENLYCTLNFAKDNEQVFLRQKQLHNVDADSFEFMDPYGFYFKDKNNVYRSVLEGKGLVCESDRWVTMEAVNPDTFEFFGIHYIGNGEEVYHVNHEGGTTLIEGVDYDSFEVLIKEFLDYSSVIDSRYAKDKNQAYYKEDVILGIDLETFEYDYDSDQVKDKNGIYGWSDIQEMLEG